MRGPTARDIDRRMHSVLFYFVSSPRSNEHVHTDGAYLSQFNYLADRSATAVNATYRPSTEFQYQASFRRHPHFDRHPGLAPFPFFASDCAVIPLQAPIRLQLLPFSSLQSKHLSYPPFHLPLPALLHALRG